MLPALDLPTSLLASSFRMWRGLSIRAAGNGPETPIELYDFEGCPFCRLVREAATELDLDLVIYPCPAGGERFRPRAVEIGGKAQFPLMVDPNTRVTLYESADIIRYLADRYGSPEGSVEGWIRSLDVASSAFASLARGRRGTRARPSRAPKEPLELFSFEASPYSRLVRETLTELEIPYRLRNMGKASTVDMGPPMVRERFFPKAPIEGRNRKRLHALAGRVQVPYLIDPNTNVEMFESAEIVAYLEDTYAARP